MTDSEVEARRIVGDVLAVMAPALRELLAPRFPDGWPARSAGGAGGPGDPDDPSYTLGLVAHNAHDFGWSAMVRTYAFELRSSRNDWAHNRIKEMAQARRFVDTSSLLFGALGLPDVADAVARAGASTDAAVAVPLRPVDSPSVEPTEPSPGRGAERSATTSAAKKKKKGRAEAGETSSETRKRKGARKGGTGAPSSPTPWTPANGPTPTSAERLAMLRADVAYTNELIRDANERLRSTAPPLTGAQRSHARSGWYADPRDVAQLRFWDGVSWTQHVRDAGSAAADRE